MAKVWLDVLTPKQVLFFKPIVELLEKRGCSVLATSRKYREIEPIAKMNGFELRYIGERGGSALKEQLVATLERELQILPIVEDFEPDVAVSVASPVCARVAFGLGIRHIAVNDSPHSVIVGKLSLPLTERLLTPWIIPFNAWTPFGITRGRIERYRALDPVAWLKRNLPKGPVPSLDPSKKTITIRVEESYASYMIGKDRNWAESILHRLCEDFKDCNIVALCRYGEQLEGIKQKYGSKIIVPDEVVDGRALLASTDVFIGMGGTMTAESALMGVPTISTFQGRLYTESYLVSKELLIKTHSLNVLSRYVKRYLDGRYRRSFTIRARKLLNWMEDPVPRVVNSVLNSIVND